MASGELQYIHSMPIAIVDILHTSFNYIASYTFLQLQDTLQNQFIAFPLSKLFTH